MPPSKIDPLSLLREEVADYEKQKTVAQSQIDEQQSRIESAQRAASIAQQLMGQANARFLVVDGALQACQALIAKLGPAPVPAGNALVTVTPEDPAFG